MKARRKLISMILSFLALATAVSCSHKDIECPGGDRKIHVLFEWDRATGADVAGMTLFFYPQEGRGGVRRFDIAGRDGGDVELPAGSYCMIACNNDQPGIRLEDTDNPAAIRASAARRVGESIYASTGMLYGTQVSSLEVTPCGVRYTTPAGTVKECGRGLIRCQPDSMATQYKVLLKQVSGLTAVLSVTAVLEGLRSSIYLESRRPSDTPASLALDMAVDRDGATLSGRGCAFSPAAGFKDYRLSLRVVMSDGSILEKRMELKPENINIVSAHNVIIIVEGIDMPDIDSPGDIGGIGVDVEGWQVINIDLEPSFR